MKISFDDMGSERSYRKLAAALLVLGAVLANIAFIGLGSVFNYPISCKSRQKISSGNL
jgi:hypothetical protein